MPTRERYLEVVADPAYEQRVVIEDDGTPVGFWLLTVHDGWMAELRRIAALAPRRGVGTYALRRMIARAFDDLACHRAYLEVNADNAPARALYERQGFVLEGTWRDGFRAEDGTFKDLCAYGMLAADRR